MIGTLRGLLAGMLDLLDEHEPRGSLEEADGPVDVLLVPGSVREPPGVAPDPRVLRESDADNLGAAFVRAFTDKRDRFVLVEAVVDRGSFDLVVRVAERRVVSGDLLGG